MVSVGIVEVLDDCSSEGEVSVGSGVVVVRAGEPLCGATVDGLSDESVLAESVLAESGLDGSGWVESDGATVVVVLEADGMDTPA